MPSEERVTITVGGIEYAGWKSFSAKSTATSPERSFQLVGALAPPVTPQIVSAWDTKPYTVKSNGTLIQTGVVTGVEIMADEKNHECRITGKSRGRDTVRCSVDHPTQEWRNRSILDIARDIDLSGINYTSDEQLRPIDVARPQTGDTHMHFLGRLARRAGLFLTSTPQGGVAITTHGKHRHTGGIIEGDNFMKGTAKWSSENRFNKVKVRGHRGRGTGRRNVRYSSTAQDNNGPPGSVRVVVPRTDMTQQDGQTVAQHMLDTRFGDNVNFETELQGFRDQGGLIWEIGWLVWCEVPLVDLKMELAINEVNLTQDENGSIARLTLVHPKALGQKTGQRSANHRRTGGTSWRNRQIAQ